LLLLPAGLFADALPTLSIEKSIIYNACSDDSPAPAAIPRPRSVHNRTRTAEADSSGVVEHAGRAQVSGDFV
jgi:hypothetical protein